MRRELWRSAEVVSAAIISDLPVKDSPGRMTYLTEQNSGIKVVPALPRTISGAYFATMKIPILQGRSFGDEDTAERSGRCRHQSADVIGSSTKPLIHLALELMDPPAHHPCSALTFRLLLFS